MRQAPKSALTLLIATTLLIIVATISGSPVAPLVPSIAQSTGDRLPTRTPTGVSPVSPLPGPSPTATFAPLLPTITPSPEPTPVTRWLGVVAGRNITRTGGAAVAVKVSGLDELPVRLRSLGGAGAGRACTTNQDGLCTFENLAAGQYVIAPEALGSNLPVHLAGQESVSAVFDLNVLPPGITGWRARLVRNSNGPQATSAQNSRIVASIEGRLGQVVALHSARGTEQFCEVQFSDGGNLQCEFDGLGAGVYLVEAVSTGARYSLFVDGTGQADIIFSPTGTHATEGLAQSPPIVGQGAKPHRPVATNATGDAVVAQASPPPAATITPEPTATPTPTPDFAWQGRVVERDNDGGQNNGSIIGVRAVGLAEHPVVIRSGGWQSVPQSTGSQPALGPYATEFEDLTSGEYVVVLIGLADLTVSLEPNQSLLIEFRYDFIDPIPN